ncbi:double zinc ribbon domain-containing protein [Methanocella arvoryzae]|uniref:DZANK-type domain-containing protein n=1 Tax=Methanocella arvoryzae (strain DSM 22066 / NBRC 105507 / MRE50) TaxID=351160 RepID=Q0W4V1_METAR|nr:zinc ribbon domain-containing protein [Methanocella arvoryzae]CAJ36592.1 conserved hypothetical protein [Methanocella arvoryzae MRE50]
MAGYKQPCKYCGKLVPPDSNICPYCARADPNGPMKCPKCRATVEPGFKVCPHCGLQLQLTCPKCGKPTFFGAQCDACGGSLKVKCPNPKCGFEQPPTGENCVKCGKPLNAPKK